MYYFNFTMASWQWNVGFVFVSVLFVLLAGSSMNCSANEGMQTATQPLGVSSPLAITNSICFVREVQLPPW